MLQNLLLNKEMRNDMKVYFSLDKYLKVCHTLLGGEDMNKVMISLKIRKDLKEALDDVSRREGRSRTFLLQKALENYFRIKRVGKNEKK